MIEQRHDMTLEEHQMWEDLCEQSSKIINELMECYESETGRNALYKNGIPYPSEYSPFFVEWLSKMHYKLQAENTKLKAQLTWRPVSEAPPEKEKPIYPKPWRNRTYKPYIVTDGYEARFAFFAEVSKDKWWFVNPYNHHEIKNVVAWKDASLGLPIPPAPEGE